MSDLEKQASTWVPPWQRPAATPPSDAPPQGGQKDLREAAEQAAARWSATETSAPAAEPAGSAPAAEPARGHDRTAQDAVDDTEPSDDVDSAEAVDPPTSRSDDAQADATKPQRGVVPGARPNSDAPVTSPHGTPPSAEDDARAAAHGTAPDDTRAAAHGTAPDDTRAAAQGTAPDGTRAAAHGTAPDGDATAQGGQEAHAGADGDGGAARKGRAKKAGDGSLKDGLAVAEMLAKALPEQRSKASQGDPEADAEGEDEEDEEPESYREYEPGELKAALEAILMVVDEPVGELVLATVLEVRAEDVANALIDLSASYTREGRGFDLRRAAGGWRFYTRADYASYVERFVLDGQQLRLTQASLETLAVVAYKQPVTRSRISAIRGVNVDGVIRTLITRGMVEECGTDPESGAHLYRTTMLFLEKMGLDSVDQLPPLAPFLPDNLEELAAGE